MLFVWARQFATRFTRHCAGASKSFPQKPEAKPADTYQGPCFVSKPSPLRAIPGAEISIHFRRGFWQTVNVFFHRIASAHCTAIIARLVNGGSPKGVLCL
jgi:hypothetical protein